MMRGHAETTGCRRQHLLGCFGEQLLDPCGNCDNCDAGTDEFPVDSTARHPRRGAGAVMSVEEDRVTVLVDEVGCRTLSSPDVREHDLLVREDAPG